MSAPILFLDVDGVLNKRSTIATDAGVRSCELIPVDNPAVSFNGVVEVEKVEALLRVVSDCRARIVVSSSWRNAFKSGADFATAIGLSPPLASAKDLMHRDWRTGWKFTSNRHHEIGWWLDDHRSVKRYAILDDHDVCRPAPTLAKRFVRTDAEYGLTAADLDRVAALLAA